MIKFIKNILNKYSKTKNASVINETENKTAIFYALDGETERRLGKFESSIANMTKAIELEPQNDMFYITRALSYKSLENYTAALNDINKAIELNNKVEQTQKIKNEILALM